MINNLFFQTKPFNMAKKVKLLEIVYLSRLTHAEFSQFIDRQITEIEELGESVLTDNPMNQLLAELKSTAVEFHQAILQIQKSEYTDQLTVLDGIRDRAMRRYNNVLKDSRYSENPEELKAYRKLNILSTTYKGITKLNYEAESKELKKFLEELDSIRFGAEVNLLNLGNEVTRIKNSESSFNLLFNSRSHESSAKAVYDALAIRKTLQNQYNHLTAFILALANGLDKEPYNTCLKLMNTTRKYFDEILKKREGLKGVDVKPETETPT